MSKIELESLKIQAQVLIAQTEVEKARAKEQKAILGG